MKFSLDPYTLCLKVLAFSYHRNPIEKNFCEVFLSSYLCCGVRGGGFLLAWAQNFGCFLSLFFTRALIDKTSTFFLNTDQLEFTLIAIAEVVVGDCSC